MTFCDLSPSHTWEHAFFVCIVLWLGGLTYKLWQYRRAIIRLQQETGKNQDMILEYLTQPKRKR